MWREDKYVASKCRWEDDIKIIFQIFGGGIRLHPAGSEQYLMVGPCEHSSDYSEPMKGGKFFDLLNDY
jgi:hypothetical protein